MPLIQFHIDTAQLSGFIDRLGEVLRGRLNDGDVYEGFRDADEIYMDAQRQTFDAEGGGDWQSLAKSTEEDRERLGFTGPHLILHRSGALREAFKRGAPGNVWRVDPEGITSGFGGPGQHPPYRDGSGGNATISQVAAWQHHGTGRIPARPLLREPTSDLLSRMAEPINQGFRRAIEAAIRG